MNVPLVGYTDFSNKALIRVFLRSAFINYNEGFNHLGDKMTQLLRKRTYEDFEVKLDENADEKE